MHIINIGMDGKVFKKIVAVYENTENGPNEGQKITGIVVEKGKKV